MPATAANKHVKMANVARSVCTTPKSALESACVKSPARARSDRIFPLPLIETGWPRERDSQIVSVPEFGAITARLWTLLRAQSMQALRPEAL